LGYPATQKGYKLLNLVTDKTFVSRDVIFYEHIFPFQQSSMNQYKYPLPAFFPDNPPAHHTAACEDDDILPCPTTDQAQDQQDSIVPSRVALSDEPTEAAIPSPSAPCTSSLPAPLRATSRVSKKPGWLQDYVTMTTIRSPISDDLTYEYINPDYRAYLSATAHFVDPVLFTQAVQDEKWGAAMNLELRALENNDTWFITTLPPSKKAIGCKWIYRTKFNSDGTVDKHKARLVAQGFSQQFGVDYDETFSPVAKMTTVRTLLVVTTVKHWCVHRMDVSNAFLHGDLQEEVYMALPQGYAGRGCKITPLSAGIGGVTKPRTGDQVCKLLKSLYGLKQAPRQWFTKLTLALIAYGFHQSKENHTLFTKICDNGEFLTVLIYVDDMILIASNPSSLADLKQYLHTQFHMKDLGVLSYFLGLEITSSSKGFLSAKRSTLIIY